MKAAVCTKYGPPEVVKIMEVPQPICRKNEVLVKIMASSVNSGDVRVRGLAASGAMKLLMQLALGFSKPRKPVLGVVFSGIVERTGSQVKRFKPGDKVFGITGFRFGAHAEYICVKENSVMDSMPANAGFDEAAALPFGWHTAIHFLDKAKIGERERPQVLIYGATGSVGAAAVQYAQSLKAGVTAVCSTRGKALMEQLGIQEPVFYDLRDFTITDRRFDIIFDAAGTLSKQQCRHLLKKKGCYVTVGGFNMATEKISHLRLVRRLFEKGACRATIDRTYPFSEIVEAHRYVDTRRKKGDVVLLVH